MRVLLVTVLAGVVAGGSALPMTRDVMASSAWGSSYGDPTGFCPAQSYLPDTYQSLVTNDPLVGANPEQDTFFGYHQSPGYDDWFGYWYGSINGITGFDSGWLRIGTSPYGSAGHWNFDSFGWQVHGHVKQYIAYYNWTFGGQCGMGHYGSLSPAPYMADVDGYPVVDIYVDATPPADPKPRVSSASPSGLSFTWDPVEDQGEGAGADYFAVGMDHYTSWLSVDGGPPLDRAESPAPRVLSAALTPSQTACALVIATDRLGNSTRAQSVCGKLSAPPPPPPPLASAGRIEVNPSAPGLAGLPAWFWLQPTPLPVTTYEAAGGVQYRIVADPQDAEWDFGDGTVLAAAEFGKAYPQPSTVQHTYGTASRIGYPVTATVHYRLEWWFLSGDRWVGGYPLGIQSAPADGLKYQVRQAQPELESAA